MDNKNSTNSKAILIIKASGEKEVFSPEKLTRSLFNAGAKKETASKIVADIQSWIYPGITTKKIYKHAFSILYKERSTNSSLRYRLKQAILELGPTGYPFEILIGQLFQHKGFRTKVGVEVDGKCISHEMDVIATDNFTQHLAECKYHKDQGKPVSVQVPLYVRSRVNDIIEKRKGMLEFQNLKFSAWVITNTHFSPDAIHYGNGAGINLLAWNYPIDNGLNKQIEKYKLYPITVLKNLTVKAKKHFLKLEIVSCLQLLNNLDTLKTLDLSKAKYIKLIAELNKICS